jgi:hypothetical protein
VARNDEFKQLALMYRTRNILESKLNRTREELTDTLRTFLRVFPKIIENIKNTFLGRSLVRMDENAANNRYI